MKHIQAVEINYGVIGSNYNIDNKGHVDVEDIEGQNYMLDAEGKEVKRWFGTGGGSWGKGNIPIGGSKSPARLPKTVHLGYYDTVEQQAYTAEFELPQERIYELMQLKTITSPEPHTKLYVVVEGIRASDVKLVDESLALGIAHV